MGVLCERFCGGLFHAMGPCRSPMAARMLSRSSPCDQRTMHCYGGHEGCRAGSLEWQWVFQHGPIRHPNRGACCRPWLPISISGRLEHVKGFAVYPLPLGSCCPSSSDTFDRTQSPPIAVMGSTKAATADQEASKFPGCYVWPPPPPVSPLHDQRGSHIGPIIYALGPVSRPRYRARYSFARHWTSWPRFSSGLRPVVRDRAAPRSLGGGRLAGR